MRLMNDANPPGERRYSTDETGEIIRRATQISQLRDSDDLDVEEIVGVAAEVGIDREAVEQAIQLAEREAVPNQMRTNTAPPGVRLPTAAWRFSVSNRRSLQVLDLRITRTNGS